MQKELTCFKAYDIRGEININIDEAIAYRIGRSVAQHFKVNFELLVGSATGQLPRDFSQSLFHVDHALQAAHPVNAFKFAYFKRQIFDNLLQLCF